MTAKEKFQAIVKLTMLIIAALAIILLLAIVTNIIPANIAVIAFVVLVVSAIPVSIIGIAIDFWSVRHEFVNFLKFSVLLILYGYKKTKKLLR